VLECPRHVAFGEQILAFIKREPDGVNHLPVEFFIITRSGGMQERCEIVADIRRPFHPIPGRERHVGRVVHDANDRRLLYGLLVGDERMHDAAQQATCIGVSLLDSLAIVVFDQAVEAEVGGVGAQLEDEECAIANMSQMQACEFTSEMLGAGLEWLHARGDAFQLSLGCRMWVELEHGRDIGI